MTNEDILGNKPSCCELYPACKGCPLNINDNVRNVCVGGLQLNVTTGTMLQSISNLLRTKITADPNPEQDMDLIIGVIGNMKVTEEHKETMVNFAASSLRLALIASGVSDKKCEELVCGVMDKILPHNELDDILNQNNINYGKE